MSDTERARSIWQQIEQNGVTGLSDDDLLFALTRDYAAPMIPCCCVCSGPLVRVDSNNGVHVYGCQAEPEIEHRRKSLWADHSGGGDARVMELIRRYARS